MMGLNKLQNFNIKFENLPLKILRNNTKYKNGFKN